MTVENSISEQGCLVSPNDLTTPTTSSNHVTTPPVRPPHGPRYQGQKVKLISADHVRVCRVRHKKTIVSKLVNSRMLRRWQTHMVVLGPNDISSKKKSGHLTRPINYSNIDDIWVLGDGKFIIRIQLHDGYILLQTNNLYTRDQWYHSIQWKKHIYKYKNLLLNTSRPEIFIREIQHMIGFSLSTRIYDDSVSQFPLDLLSQLLKENAVTINNIDDHKIIMLLSPLLENRNPTKEICEFFTNHCINSPRSEIVIEIFTPVINRLLKYNMDFGKHPRMRKFIYQYLQSLNILNDGQQIVYNFIQSIHTPTSICPHLRILPNMVSICLAAIYSNYEKRKLMCLSDSEQDSGEVLATLDSELSLYLRMIEYLAAYSDWLPVLACLLQTVPFPSEALLDKKFISGISRTLDLMIVDKRCSVHTCLLNLREYRHSWLSLFSIGGATGIESGEMFSKMLNCLLSCCCRNKKFARKMFIYLNACMLLALKEIEPAIDLLCAFLEFDLFPDPETGCPGETSGDLSDSSSFDLTSHTDNETNVQAMKEIRMQLVTTLQSTDKGKKAYVRVCDKKIELYEFQKKEGPRKLTLPSKSTDQDLTNILNSGSFGNLECLSLAFTQVTSECAKEIIKLPSLRYLNLWSTQFGDKGLQLVSEHLQKLQILNLCETPISDKGLLCISGMKSLKKLNLNSTKLSALTFEGIKKKLPGLLECDIRYTEAW